MTPLVDRIADRARDWIVLLARLALAALYLPSGFNKLLHLTNFADGLAAKGVPAPTLLAVLGAACEFLGALALLLGFLTRYAALLLVGFTIVASVVSHHFWDVDDAARQMQYIQFMKNMAITAGFLLLFVHGPGSLSLGKTK
jgi:putative oxidoreductase